MCFVLGDEGRTVPILVFVVQCFLQPHGFAGTFIFRKGVRCYVHKIEETLIQVCRRFGIEAERSPHTGVWVGEFRGGQREKRKDKEEQAATKRDSKTQEAGPKASVEK